jgi:putative membrane protein
MAKSKVDITVPQKQSAIALVLSLLKVLRELWAFFLVIGINILSKKEASNKAYIYFIGGFIALIFLKLNTILSYFTTRFYVNNLNELVHTTGLFVRKKTVINSSKIQTIQANQNLLNKLSNTYKVQIQTAGTSKAEVELFAINIDQLDALQNILSHSSNVSLHNTDVSKESSYKYSLNFKGLLKLCISENHIQSFLIIVAFLFGKLQEFKDYISEDTTNWLTQKADGLSNGVAAFVIFFIFCMFIAITFSCIRIVLKYYDYTINFNLKNLDINWGLINTQRKIIAYKKIQTIEWRSNGIRRLLNLSIGSIVALGEDVLKKDGSINIPITQHSLLQELINKFNNNLLFNHKDYLTIDTSYITRNIILIGLPTSLVSCLAALVFKKYFAFPIVLFWLLYFIISKWIFKKRFKLYVNEIGLKIYKGVWGTQEQVIVWENIQKIIIHTSPYQRKHELATLHLLNAGKQITIPYIDSQKAKFIADYSLYKTETCI